jgi:hypothetical protein
MSEGFQRFWLGMETQDLFERIKRNYPLLYAQLLQEPELTIDQYLSAQLSVPQRPNSWRADFYRVVEAETANLYGPDTAARALADLLACPVVLTANHHGIDTFADSAQATLLFGLWQRRLAHNPTTLTVLACSSVSLSNPTYPAGIRIYDVGSGPLDDVPRRVRIFPHSQRHCMVSAAAPFTADMITRAGSAIRTLGCAGALSQRHVAASLRFIEQSLGDLRSLARTSYIDQARMANGDLWSQICKDSKLPDLVFLDFESISKQLVQLDLTKPDSLIARLLLDDGGRRLITDSLDGVTACWKRTAFYPDSSFQPGAQSRGGTMMFWGIGASGQRYPLQLTDDCGVPTLRGSDVRGAEVRVRLQANHVSDALADGLIIPSLFTGFLVLALQRDLVCAGGYYQSEYLPAMQQGVVHALSQLGHESKQLAERIAYARTGCCLSALQPIVQVNHRGDLLPAGPIEIGTRGISGGALDACLDVSVVEATQIALLDLAPDLTPKLDITGDFVARLSGYLSGERRQAICIEL